MSYSAFVIEGFAEPIGTAYNVSDFVPRPILDGFRAEIRNRSSTDVTEPPLDPQGEITELIANFQTDMSSRLWNETGPSILDVRQGTLILSGNHLPTLIS